VRAFWLVVALGLSGCAHEQARLEALQKLDEPSKELFSKYRQFLTELQKDRFLAKESFEQRQEMITGLHIEERLAHYTRPVQEAIWGMTIIAGMDKPAVLLTWGAPQDREVDEAALERGVENEKWGYDRGDIKYVIVIVNGYVTEVIEGKR
jgi:hypothetical protein